MAELRIGKTLISDDSDCYVIAEIGNNHQGDMEKARDLFRAAKYAGVDAVKLQKRDNRVLYTKAAYDKPYENENSFGTTYGEHRNFLEFGWDEYVELKALAAELELDFMATAFDMPSAAFLGKLDIDGIKVASGDLRNIPLIKYLAGFGKPLIVSLGGGTLQDAVNVHEAVIPINSQLCFLQCTASYPTLPEDMNLRVVESLRERFPDCIVGLSDHFNGIAMAVVAYVLGARVVEKHFTLNHTWKGTDHALSLEPTGMHRLTRDLRRVRRAMGDAKKNPLPVEAGAIVKMGKSLYAARTLAAGHVLAVEDIALKSPGGGISPVELESVIGKTLANALEEDEFIQPENLQ